MSYFILTDTSANLPTPVCEEWELERMPFAYILDGKEYTCMDTENFDDKEYYGKLRSGVRATTSMVAQEAYYEAMTRRAADWLRKLGGCRPIAVLSDECEDVVWQCAPEQVDLLLLETDFSDGVEDKDVSARCEIAVRVRQALPKCRVCLLSQVGYPEKRAALDKAGELHLIDGYCLGDLTARQVRSWLSEATQPTQSPSTR